MQNEQKLNGITCALIGASGCGKSHLLKNIFLDDIFLDDSERIKNGMYPIGQSKKMKYIIIFFTKSAKSDEFIEGKNILNKTFMIDKSGVDEDLINYCYNVNLKTDKKYRFVIMLDDCIHIRYKKLIESMFLTMRNMGISSVVSLQYSKLIPPAIRISVFFTFLFAQNSEEGIEIVVRSWLSSYLQGCNVKEKMETFRLWTNSDEGHNFYVMDNLNHTCFRVNSKYETEELAMLSCATGIDESSGNGLTNSNTSIIKKPNDDDGSGRGTTNKRNPILEKEKVNRKKRSNVGGRNR